MNVNPMQMMLNQMMSNPRIKNNPMAQNAIQMYQNGDIQGLQNMAENICKERGMTTDEAKQKIMGMFGGK